MPLQCDLTVARCEGRDLLLTFKRSVTECVLLPPGLAGVRLPNLHKSIPINLANSDC